MSPPREPLSALGSGARSAGSWIPWTVWLAMTIGALLFVASYASPYPLADDLEMAYAFGPEGARPLGWWWSQHMEHRVPLPRLFYVSLVDVTGDLRSTMYAEVVLLSALSFAAIRAARRLRGSASWTDAFLPLLFLHVGNGENLLLGFCLSVTLPVVLGVLAWMSLASGPEVPGGRGTAVAAACLVSLPLCGGHGLVQVPSLALALGLVALALVRSGDPPARRSGRALALAVGATLVLSGLYFVGFERPPVEQADPSLRDALRTSLQYLSLSFGPVAAETWPWSGALVLAVAVAAMAQLARVLRTEPRERLRATALFGGIGAVLTMAAAVGIARSHSWSAGWMMRYVVQPAPLCAAAYFAFCLPGGAPLAGRIARAALALLLAAALLPNVRAGIENGRRRESILDRFERDAERLSLVRLAARHWQHFYPDREGFESRMRLWVEAGLVDLRLDPPHPPSWAAPAENEPDPAFMLEEPALSWRSDRAVGPRRAGLDWVVVVPAEGELRFALPDGARELFLGFGLHPSCYREGAKVRTDGVVFRCEHVGPDGSTQVLFECELDPVARAEDRGTRSASIPLAGTERGLVVLRTTNREGRTTDHDAAYWSSVRFD